MFWVYKPGALNFLVRCSIYVLRRTELLPCWLEVLCINQIKAFYIMSNCMRRALMENLMLLVSHARQRTPSAE